MLTHLLMRYGYWAVLVGTFFEGETILALAGYGAHRGYLRFDWVVLLAIVGSVASDQLAFLLGRRRGAGFLERRPRWQPRVKRVKDLIERHGVWIMLGFRFLYGLRNVTPFTLGILGTPWRRFLLFNVLGAALWALVVAGGGYALGQGLELLIARAHRLEEWVLGLGLLAGAAAWLISWLRERRVRA